MLFGANSVIKAKPLEKLDPALPYKWVSEALYGANAVSAAKVHSWQLPHIAFIFLLNQANPGGVYVFPVDHCGAYVLNTHRKLPAQIQDWKRMGNSLLRLFVEEPNAQSAMVAAWDVVSGASTEIYKIAVRGTV